MNTRSALVLVLGLGLAPSAARAEVHIVDSSVTQTIDCATDPEISIDGSSNTITLTGACTKVAINGSVNELAIASAVKIAVNGSNNTVDVDAADKITVTGSNNKVTYKRAVTAKKKTKTSKLGTGNTIKKVK